jgi:hypothetical protein
MTKPEQAVKYGIHKITCSFMSRGNRLALHATRMENKKYIKHFVGNPRQKRLSCKLTSRREDNIKTNFKK